MSVVFSNRLLHRLASARAVVAFTGAGVSAESGVPTFRGPDGIWGKFEPEELANVDAFMRNPELVWAWYKHRQHIISSVQPNPGHHAIAEMERLFPVFSVVTQNIDNLHRRAGSSNVIELHGNIERSYCMKCGAAYVHEDIIRQDGAPHCTRMHCSGLIRPDVVWFGEMLPDDEWNKAISAAGRADVFFSIGTSAVVHPAAALPLTAKHQGALLVEINPEPTSITANVDEFLQGSSGKVLPALCERMKRLRETPAPLGR